MFVIDFDKLHFRELFEVLHERPSNVIERAIGQTRTSEIYIHNTIGKDKFAVASEAIENQRQPLVAFHVTRTFEEFIKRRA